MRTARPVVLSLMAASLWACTDAAPDRTRDDTPTAGDVLIVADIDFERVLEAQRFVFESIYPNATVRLRYAFGDDLRKAMMNDSVRVVFTTCLPGADEQAFFRTRSLFPVNVPILTDGIVLFKGPGTTPPPLDPAGLEDLLQRPGPAMVFVDNARSNVARSLADSLFKGDPSAMHGLAARPGMDSLLARVAHQPGSWGLISFARISDVDDADCRALRGRMSIVPLADGNGGPAVLPSQSDLGNGRYPLRRKLFAVLKEGRTGLGTGFVSFVAGHKGQRIILKSGLLPQTIPGRDVELVAP